MSDASLCPPIGQEVSQWAEVAPLGTRPLLHLWVYGRCCFQEAESKNVDPCTCCPHRPCPSLHGPPIQEWSIGVSSVARGRGRDTVGTRSWSPQGTGMDEKTSGPGECLLSQRHQQNINVHKMGFEQTHSERPCAPPLRRLPLLSSLFVTVEVFVFALDGEGLPVFILLTNNYHSGGSRCQQPLAEPSGRARPFSNKEQSRCLMTSSTGRRLARSRQTDRPWC